MVLYVDYFTQGILNYKSYYVAGWEARNHVANKQINLQGYLTRKNPHRPHAQPALVEITYFVRRLYRWKVPGGEWELQYLYSEFLQGGVMHWTDY